MKHIHQDEAAEVEPHTPELRFVSPQKKTDLNSVRYKAGIKSEHWVLLGGSHFR